MEQTMKSDRRTFLKTTGVVGGALLAGVAARGASTAITARISIVSFLFILDCKPYLLINHELIIIVSFTRSRIQFNGFSRQ